MLGHTLFNEFFKNDDFEVYGTARSIQDIENFFHPDSLDRIRTGVDAELFDTIIRAMASIQPDIVINCIGLIKQLPKANDPLSAITVNAQLPHRISLVCRTVNARLIHISTDCVFDGNKGNYTETDCSSANDLYGRTKFLGEVNYPHCLTIRTSIIGHEIKNHLGLVEWFLNNRKTVNGFTNAIYSGFPTIELVKILSKWIIPNPDLQGLYHVASNPISKFDLLKKIACIYKKNIKINKHEEFRCDRSLDSTLFQDTTGYHPPHWSELIKKMNKNYRSAKIYNEYPLT